NAVDTGDEAVGTQGDVFRRFTTGAAIAEEFPSRLLLQNLARPFPLVTAVVPFDQVQMDLRDMAEPSQRACLRGPLQGAGENPAEGKPVQALAQPSRVRFPAFIKRQTVQPVC